MTVRQGRNGEPLPVQRQCLADVEAETRVDEGVASEMAAIAKRRRGD